MSPEWYKKGPNVVHLTMPGAVGSRNSTAQEGRDKVAEAKLIIDDTVSLLRRKTGRVPVKTGPENKE